MVHVKTRLCFLALLLFVVAGCTESASDSGERRFHPNPELFASREMFDWILRLGEDGDVAPSDLAQLAKRLQTANRQWRIGSWLSSWPWEMFGRIIDVEHDQKGRIFVLDEVNTEVRVFSPEGVYLFSVGAKGEGPGEFLNPEWIALDEQDTLYVADRRRRIEVFAPYGEQYAYVRTIILPISPIGGLCVNDTSIFIHSDVMEKDESLIYHLDKDGNIVNKFGSLEYHSDEPIVLMYITRGYMACNSRGDLLLIAFRNAPIVQAYRSDGSLLWQLWIEGLDLVGFTERATGGVSLNKPSKEHATILTRIVNVSKKKDLFLIQYARSESGEIDKASSFAYLINVGSKKAKFISVNNIFMIFDIWGENFIAHEYDKIPHISYYVY